MSNQVTSSSGKPPCGRCGGLHFASYVCPFLDVAVCFHCLRNIPAEHGQNPDVYLHRKFDSLGRVYHEFCPFEQSPVAHESAREQEAASEQPVPDLYSLAFMPDQFRCPQCDFQLSKRTMFVASGQVGLSESDLESEPCPNDGTPMVHVTYKEQLEAYADRLTQEFATADKLRAEIADLKQELKNQHAASGSMTMRESYE